MARNQLLQLVAVSTLAGAGFLAAKSGSFGGAGKKFASGVEADARAAFGKLAVPPGPSGAPPSQGPGPGGQPGVGTQTNQTPYGQTGSNTLDPTPDTASSSIGNSGPLVPTTLTDAGGFPVVYDPSKQTLRQDPTLHGTNVYGVGDVFFDSRDGQAWQYVMPTIFTSLSSGETHQLQDFAQS